MTFAQTYNIIAESKTFRNFKEQHPTAELVAGFFILDFISNDTKNSLDYKHKDKIFTFSLNQNNEITLTEDKLIETSTHPQLTPIQPTTNIELNRLKSITEKKASEDNIHVNFNKIIAVLQNHENKQVWNLTCMLDQLQILHVLIDSNTGEIIKFEKKSLMDFIKKK